MGKGGEGRRGGEEIQNKLNYQLVLGIIRSSSEHPIQLQNVKEET